MPIDLINYSVSSLMFIFKIKVADPDKHKNVIHSNLIDFDDIIFSGILETNWGFASFPIFRALL